VDVRLLILGLVALPACYAPDREACRIQCGPGGACPSGSACGPSGYCQTPGESPFCGAGDAAPPSDGASPPDGASDALGADGPPAADALACPPGYVAGPTGSFYRFTDDERTWPDAEADCEDDGPTSHLVVPDSQAENDWLRANESMDVKIWIGITDRVAEGTFLRVTGGAPGFTAWSGTPDSPDCAVIWRNDDLGRWHTEGCEDAGFPQLVLCECDGRAADPSAF
jgi:hypothetical protein